ncbi:ribosomal protection-like ABC-F family protein [Kroppenstedtia eburnea]|uniref:ATPase components of ABC transporters with duplicated ATPase domains n=1 Tax=Kroppenstedtia eburnea TaxID=714067 RepID=A0A1N7LAR5_9BACL|nr:ABC-F type ribosomal protection protein [Kroppenstedtia eburnea]QKI81440.1 ABC-F type ribosomal protection protein [Kroppenstedtia eburnea]SIS70965.1 ATPase components of ABC transporters with duplicated ATPase domains [Kroppenstedtia eburnea]
MWVLKAEGLLKEWDGKRIFEKVDLAVREGERVALIGANGVGKTTLLNCLIGRTTPDRGRIHRQVPVSRWGMVEQQPPVPEEMTLQDWILSADPERFGLRRELARLERELTAGCGLDSLLRRYSEVQGEYQSLGGYEWELAAEGVLSRLGFTPDLQQLPYRQLSGGQKTRARLARVMAGQPSFLLLDEPTNHLDGETQDWLTEWLVGFRGACLIVSHDRAWIDQVAHTTVELTAEGTRSVKGGYSDFIREREREQREQEALYRKQQQEKKRLEEAIRRYSDWFRQAHAAAGERNPFYKKKANKHQTRLKAKEQALKRLEEQQVERPREAPRIQADLGGDALAARRLVRLEGVGFSYGKHRVFQEVDLTLSRGERLAVIGPNGSGKSTLLKLITGELAPTEGQVNRHPALRIGYFAQELDGLEPERTVLDSLLSLPGMTSGEARKVLASFLFRREDVHKRIGDLSMGERCRVAFVHLYFSEANLLVLDEPTNHLDIPTRERIEEALNHYPGTLVLVSHDRYSLDRVSNRVAVLKRGTVEVWPGGSRAYREHLRDRAERPTDPETDHKIRTLELELTRLMAAEEPETDQERKELHRQIREVKEALDALR